MDYYWEEIFKNKTNKELYEIFLGNTQLPKEVEIIAKNELDKRGFDFEKMDDNKLGWKLSGLVEEDNMEETEISGRKLYHISFFKYLLINIIFAIFFIVIAIIKGNKHTDFIVLIFISVIISLAITIINNFIVKKRSLRKDIRKKEIEIIANKLKTKGMLNEKSPIAQDFNRERQNERKVYNNIAIIGFIISVLLAIFLIYKAIWIWIN